VFFALWPELPLAQQIWQQSREPCSVPGSRSLLPEQLHLTLRFMGTVDAVQQQCLRHGAGQIHPTRFSLQLAQVGSWPKPGVLWLAPRETPQALGRLVQALETVCLACGLPAETRDFAPHLTLARKVRQIAALIHIVPPMMWPVSAFHLVESQTRAQGVKYTLLQSWSLH